MWLLLSIHVITALTVKVPSYRIHTQHYDDRNGKIGTIYIYVHILLGVVGPSGYKARTRSHDYKSQDRRVICEFPTIEGSHLWVVMWGILVHMSFGKLSSTYCLDALQLTPPRAVFFKELDCLHYHILSQSL